MSHTSAHIKVISYNIHKGFSSSNLTFTLGLIKESIKLVDADLVLLQEVLGYPSKHAATLEDGPTASQFEYLAHSVWPHFAYGKNAVYSHGHHGNAILSRFPIMKWENIDISQSRLERRGLLHAKIQCPGLSQPLHVFSLHLGLFEFDRKKQLHFLASRITKLLGLDSQLIMGGDFNDWRGIASGGFPRELQIKEAFFETQGSYAKTFPNWLPALKLDRVYFRGARVVWAMVLQGKPWSGLSDHLPLFVNFTIK